MLNQIQKNVITGKPSSVKGWEGGKKRKRCGGKVKHVDVQKAPGSRLALAG